MKEEKLFTHLLFQACSDKGVRAFFQLMLMKPNEITT
jgi:hypothetical protein